ncbi:stalk domain-containing protein [Cohnella yongneupensis]|uniref:Stalk domain-containing protein n=1 Tax=Cohnella yongneupensis TaxID=425006 RepID=A0ABW0QZK8_9BACL
MKKLHLKSLVVGLVFGVMLASTSVAFASGKISAVYSEMKLLVNGQAKSLKTKPVTINKTDYVSLNEISTLLGYTAQYNDKTKTYTISNKSSVPAKEAGVGNVKGAITWQYNDFVGTKADVGAKVFLIPTSFDKKSITADESNLYSMIGAVPKGSGLQFVKVNGFGQYELNDIPAGKYYIVISSKNTTRNSDEDLSDYVVSTLKPLFADWDTFVLFNLKLTNHEVREIEIKKGKTLDVSYDFGNTYY